MNYMVVIETGESGYGAQVPDLPGRIAVAETRGEVIGLTKCVFELPVGGGIEAGEPVPTPFRSANPLK